MLYHCLRRKPNIKTTLGRRFPFDRITTVILLSSIALKRSLMFIVNTQGFQMKGKLKPPSPSNVIST